MKRYELQTTLLRIRMRYWHKDSYIFFDKEKDEWYNNLGQKCDITPDFYSPDEWEYYTEPKKKKKFTIYEYADFTIDFEIRIIWTSTPPEENNNEYLTPTGLSRDIELDDE